MEGRKEGKKEGRKDGKKEGKLGRDEIRKDASDEGCAAMGHCKIHKTMRSYGAIRP